MLEIVFDENAGCEFLGHKYKMVEVTALANWEWNDFRKMARKLVEENWQEQILLVNFTPQGEALNNFALALSVETYEEKSKLESMVFKVKHSGATMMSYKPYMALANSIRYARDLYRLSEDEYMADIKRLGYLGLRVQEDYLKKEVTVEWPGKENEKLFVARNKNQIMVLIGIIKTWAICKEEFGIRGIISKLGSFPSNAIEIEEAKNEDEIVEKIINYVRK